MITLLASIAGFIGSLLPEIVKYFQMKNNHKHQLDLANIQMKYLQKNSELEIVKIQESINAKLYNNYNCNIRIIDAINGSVRPILAYGFFVIYILIKFVQFKSIYFSYDLFTYIDKIWNDEDQAIFAGIISFYFGQRTFRHKY